MRPSSNQCKLEESTPLASGQSFFCKERAPFSWQIHPLRGLGLERGALAVCQASQALSCTPYAGPNCPSMFISPKPYVYSLQKPNELPRNWISPGGNIYWVERYSLQVL